MKKTSKTIHILLPLIFITGITLIQSCNKETESTTQEFIADNSSFTNFASWSLDNTFNGPDPLLGAISHLNNDSTVVRQVYFKDGQNPVNSKYPVGTLIVKYSHNPEGTVNEYTAMAKRGNKFNPANGDWEWFLLNPDGTIAIDSASGMTLRGANLMNGICVRCHSYATKDLVFSK